MAADPRVRGKRERRAAQSARALAAIESWIGAREPADPQLDSKLSGWVIQLFNWSGSAWVYQTSDTTDGTGYSFTGSVNYGSHDPVFPWQVDNQTSSLRFY